MTDPMILVLGEADTATSAGIPRGLCRWDAHLWRDCHWESKDVTAKFSTYRYLLRFAFVACRVCLAPRSGRSRPYLTRH